MTRNNHINVRISDQEREALNILAARAGQGLSEFTRGLIREAIETRGDPLYLTKYRSLALFSVAPVDASEAPDAA